MRKSINSTTQKFEDQITEELVLDAVPTVNSFNGVTSDGVARAIAGASGEVPQVTESDNGKVLKAIYDEGGPAVAWGEGVTVDQTYDAASTNAQSGVAVASAISGVNAVPASTSSDENKVLTVNSSGNAAWSSQGNAFYATYGTTTFSEIYRAHQTGRPVFLRKPASDAAGGYLIPLQAVYAANPTASASSYASFVVPFGKQATGAVHLEKVDNTVYRVTGLDVWTTDYQGVGVFPEITTAGKVLKSNKSGNQTSVYWATAHEVPASTSSDENKVLTVNSSGTPVWATAQGGGGGMLPPIADNTVRCRFAAGYTPTMGTDGNVCVDTANNIWDITDNTSFQSKFLNNTNLLEVLGARLTTVSTRSCNNMFGGCSALTKAVDLYLSTEGDTYSAYNASYMFSSSSSLRRVEFTKMDVMNAAYMFYGCPKLEEHLGLNSPYLVNASGMFEDCYALRVGYMGDRSKVENMSYMYSGCHSLTQIPWELGLPQYPSDYCLDHTFEGCRSLESLPTIANAEHVSSTLHLTSTFAWCSNAVNGVKKAYDALSSIPSIGPTTSCFEGCGINSYSGQQERAQIPAAWGGTGA